MRQSANHFQRWEVPPPTHRVRQFFHGLALPVHLLRALWADPVARRFYLRVGILQSLVVLGVSVALNPSRDKAVDAPLLGSIDQEFQFWLALFGLMQIVQWGVIALSRDYHDAISREASLLTALEPEDGPLTPRVRLDLKWLSKKISRRIRAFVVFLAGLPVLYAFTAPFPIRHQLLAVLIPAWSAYWLVVFTPAKSAYAWKNSDAREPWFLRGWSWLTTRVPGFRWSFLQRYGLFWANRTREVFPPAAELEKQPWAFAGLTVIRMLSMLPLAKCFLRPLIPVAAGHLLVARQQAELAASPKHLEPPAQPPAASSPVA